MTLFETDIKCVLVYQQLFMMFPPLYWEGDDFDFSIGGLQPANLVSNLTFDECIFRYQGILHDEEMFQDKK